MDAEKTTRPVAAHRFVVPANDAGKRLDLILAERVPELSRRRARLLISAGAVSIDRHRVLVQSRPVLPGQEIVCHLQSFDFPRAAGDASLPILHEDEALLAVDKPTDMPSHPTYARKLGTALQVAEEMLRRRGGAKVPLWPLHRLDTVTSGVLLFAKTQRAARAVNQNFARRRIGKRYLAIVAGTPAEAAGEIRLALVEGHLWTETSVAGKEAITAYRVVEALPGAALVELEPTTGRMHQLRVHLAAIGHPILGDPKYGTEALAAALPAARLMLHASWIELPHPVGGAPFAITSPTPADFVAEIERRRQG
jgi:23S rRNA pseudouridine1911/1915/1917 synthase